MKIINDIKLNLSGDNSVVKVMAKQYDQNSRFIQCSFYHEGIAYELPKQTAVRVILKKPDGKLIMADAATEENTASFELTAQMLATAGRANCEVQLYQEETMLSTSTFPVIIFPVTYDEGEIESTAEYQSFVNALNTFDSLENETKEAISAANHAAETVAGAVSQAETQAAYAKTQGDYAKGEYERLKDVDFSGMQAEIGTLQTDVSELQTSIYDMSADLTGLQEELMTAQNGIEAVSAAKGQPNGLASLDEAGKLVLTAGLATLDSNNQLIQRTGLATLGTDGKLEAGQVPKQYPNGIWFAENGNNEFPGLSYNGTALWLGGSALSGPRHTGATTISAGGRDTAYVAVFPEEGDGASYQIWHKGMTFKSLWDGSWSSGTITVPGIQDYNMFRIGMEGQGTVITAYRWGSHLRGIGGYVSSAGNKLAYLFTATLSENTLTWVNCVDIYINNSSTVDPLTVTTIYGIL